MQLELPVTNTVENREGTSMHKNTCMQTEDYEQNKHATRAAVTGARTHAGYAKPATCVYRVHAPHAQRKDVQI